MSVHLSYVGKHVIGELHKTRRTQNKDFLIFYLFVNLSDLNAFSLLDFGKLPLTCRVCLITISSLIKKNI